MSSGHDQDSLLQSALDRLRRRAEHDEELQRLSPLSETREGLIQGARSSIECLARSCELHADRPCFGEGAPALRFTSYAELWSRVEATASGLVHERLVDAGTFVGICGFGSVDWVVADLACLYLAAVSAPIQTGASPADLRTILDETGIRCVVCSLAQLELLASVLPDCPTVESLVVMDVDEQDRSALDAWALARQTLEEEHGADLRVLRLSEVEHAGRRGGLVPYVEPSQRRDAEPDPLMTLMYTSSSTGSPKGAMFPESIWSSFWRSPSFGRFPSIPHVSVSYMPLNHLAGRGGIMRSIREGGLTTFVSRSDMSTLFEDIRRARPTSLMLIPRAASMIYQHFQSELVKRAVARGIDRHDMAGRERVAAEIMGEMRGSFLGDRLVYATSATAPTAPEVRDFIERCFEIPLLDTYGSTEAGAISFNNRILSEAVTAFKIVSVPELGYRTTDQPFPRGELCVKSPRIIPGYYRNPEATRELFDEEGYLKTGDVFEQRGPDEVVWIDRKKNVLKLAQGEVVSTTLLEEL